MLTRRAAVLGLASTACARLARPPPLEAPLSDDARTLWRRAWAGLDPSKVIDCHVHLVGRGDGGTGCYLNPELTQAASHPIKALRFEIYREAAGVSDPEHDLDRQYLEVLIHRMRSQLIHGRALLLAFDQVYDEYGKPRPELSEFHTPNDYALKCAREHPELFVAAASVHPLRPGAVEELHRCAEAGAVAVKWLPNAMRIDPAAAYCDRFYEAMAKLGLVLLSHAGEERAVEAGEAQRLGNPLKLRRALDHGVKTVIAHCASLGQNPDLDDPKQPWVDNFVLFTRLMEEPRWEGLLFGDVSAMPQANRAGRPLTEVLRRSEWHARLLNGSDYPLPAINVVVQTRVLKDLGYLSSRERAALNELDRLNPLEFDFVLKRTLTAPGEPRARFADQVFMRGDLLHTSGD
ncbi:MAG: amidohydrolase family protein [Myxococcaceae bacterium]